MTTLLSPDSNYWCSTKPQKSTLTVCQNFRDNAINRLSRRLSICNRNQNWTSRDLEPSYDVESSHSQCVIKRNVNHQSTYWGVEIGKINSLMLTPFRHFHANCDVQQKAEIGFRLVSRESRLCDDGLQCTIIVRWNRDTNGSETRKGQ